MNTMKEEKMRSGVEQGQERFLELRDSTCSAGSFLAPPRRPFSISDSNPSWEVSLAFIVGSSVGPASKARLSLETSFGPSMAIIIYYPQNCKRNTGLITN